MSDWQRAPQSSGAATCIQRRRVLVVDDNEDAATMLAEALSLFGFTTALAHDGRSAVEVAERFHPDAALIDIGLPVMDGYEVARRIRDMPSLASVLLVAVTGYGMDSDREATAAAGFDHHLVKPVDLSAVRSVLAEGS